VHEGWPVTAGGAESVGRCVAVSACRKALPDPVKWAAKWTIEGRVTPEVSVWYERGDLNPHPLRDRYLKPARLPIPPLSHTFCP
jgi:hypothetical protein